MSADTPIPDIPQDIWDAAENAFDLMLCNDIEASGTSAQFRTDSIIPHARAIMAERERCAQIAQLWAPPPQPMPEPTKVYRTFEVADAIAAAIRGAQ